MIPLFLEQAKTGKLNITDDRMTRYMITLDEAVKLVWHAFEDMIGGEIYVKKIPSMKVTDIASTVDPEARQETIGIRPGEKLHEQMIGTEDAPYTYEYDGYFKILPQIYHWDKDTLRIKDGKPVAENFSYSSDANTEWMTVDTLKSWIEDNKNKIGKN